MEQLANTFAFDSVEEKGVMNSEHAFDLDRIARIARHVEFESFCRFHLRIRVRHIFFHVANMLVFNRLGRRSWRKRFFFKFEFAICRSKKKALELLVITIDIDKLDLKTIC